MIENFILPIVRSPLKLLFVSWSFVVFTYLISPIQFNQGWSLKTLIFIWGFFAVFMVSYLLGKDFVITLAAVSGKNLIFIKKCKFNINNNFITKKLINYRLDKFTFIISLIGLIGSFMLAVDLLFGRGIDFSQGLSAARDSMHQQVSEQGGIPTGHPWSIAARVFSGFLPVAALISLLRMDQLRASTLRLVFISLILQFASDSLSGGRNTIFMTLLLLVMAIFLRISQKREPLINRLMVFKKFKKWSSLIFIAFIGYIFFIFIERESIRGRNLIQSYENIQNAWLLTFSFDVNSFVQNEGIIAHTILAVVYLLVYIVHSLNEINLLCSQIPEPGPFYGIHSLFLPALLANKLGWISSDSIVGVTESLKRSGVYFTALGSIYLDFGYTFSFIIFFVFGFIMGFIWKLFKLGYGLYIEMLCAYFLLTIVLSPFYLSINTGNGFQILSALIISGTIISLMKMDRLKVNNSVMR
ncbi:MAG: hypothetical protein RIG63_16160 [Coleofasciculus chthonoplastes F3-SA18-01]|uniref:hypothetical protein n=1 Tax=Coleofasciculus chthonoplastes TaxID=64178 RepID=UPI0032FCB5AF